MRNLFSMIAFVFFGFALTGCYDFHGYTPPVMTMGDAGPATGDAGWPMPESDSGSIEPDAGPVVTADAGSDAGPVVEPDAGFPPDLAIRTNNLRPSTILVAGGEEWRQVATFQIDSEDSIPSMDVCIQGDAADTSAVAIAYRGIILGTGILPSGTNTTAHVELSDPFVSPTDPTQDLMVWVRVPSVMSNAATGGVHDGNPMSGDSFRVGLCGVERYIGSDRLRTLFGPMLGNEFVIRASRPTFTRQALSTTTIANGTDQDLYKFQVSADAAGSIALRRIGMTMEINSTAGRVCDLRLRRGSTEVPPGDYAIGGPMFWAGDRCWTAGSLPITIWFYGDTITGSGNSYTVFGTPEGFVAGDTITVGFNRLADDRVITGYLGSVWSSTSTDIALDPSPFGAPGSMRASAGLIWSDLSEVPHSWHDGGAGGSRDWTNGYLIEDLTETQTLTR